MAFIRGKGRMRRGPGAAKVIEAIYEKNNIVPVVTINEAPEQTVDATESNFALNIEANIMNEFAFNLPFPDQYVNDLITLIDVCREKEFGEYVSMRVQKMNQKFITEEFVSFMYTILTTSNLETLLINDADVKQENSIIYDIKLEINHLKRLTREYNDFLLFVQKNSKFFIECNDSSGNIFGYSRSFLYAEYFRKPIQISVTINDTTSSSKDGFNLNEEFFLRLNVNSPDRKKLLFTSLSNLALDKATISINSLTLQR